MNGQNTLYSALVLMHGVSDLFLEKSDNLYQVTFSKMSKQKTTQKHFN